MNKLMPNFIIWIFAIISLTCTNQVNDGSGIKELTSVKAEGSSENDSLIVGKADIEKIYSQAIFEFIGAVHKKDSIKIDALYLGKHTDFPNIELPKTIGDTKIQILKEEAIGNNKSIYRNSSPFLNIFGFFKNNEAEFIFVAFYPEFNHPCLLYTSRCV